MNEERTKEKKCKQTRLGVESSVQSGEWGTYINVKEKKIFISRARERKNGKKAAKATTRLRERIFFCLLPILIFFYSGRITTMC
jgi:hypothetical protein